MLLFRYMLVLHPLYIDMRQYHMLLMFHMKVTVHHILLLYFENHLHRLCYLLVHTHNHYKILLTHNLTLTLRILPMVVQNHLHRIIMSHTHTLMLFMDPMYNYVPMPLHIMLGQSEQNIFMVMYMKPVYLTDIINQLHTLHLPHIHLLLSLYNFPPIQNYHLIIHLLRVYNLYTLHFWLVDL